LRFGSVQFYEIKTANQIKWCGLGKNNVWFKLNAVFGLDWFGLQFYFWIGFDMTTYIGVGKKYKPNRRTVKQDE
jgi:hypothetical protein